jgi:hypothetical protein
MACGIRYAWGMTLLDAQQYDFAKAKRRKVRSLLTITAVLVLAMIGRVSSLQLAGRTCGR